jgi:hypothetical protein
MSSILAELNIRPIAILPVRNPLEVARSLERRDKFPISKSILLWLRHVLDAEFHSRCMIRFFLAYEEFLAAWRDHMDRVAGKTGISWPVCAGVAGFKVDEFLSAELRHNRVSSDEITTHPQIPALVRDAYSIMMSIATKGESKDLLDKLDRVRTEFDDGCQTFGPAVAAMVPAYQELITERDRLLENYVSVRSERDALAADRDRMIVELNALVGSRHNRMTE